MLVLIKSVDVKEYFVFNEGIQAVLENPVRHLLTASIQDINALVSRDGYWNSLDLNLGLEAGNKFI